MLDFITSSNNNIYLGLIHLVLFLLTLVKGAQIGGILLRKEKKTTVLLNTLDAYDNDAEEIKKLIQHYGSSVPLARFLSKAASIVEMSKIRTIYNLDLAKELVSNLIDSYIINYVKGLSIIPIFSIYNAFIFVYVITTGFNSQYSAEIDQVMFCTLVFGFLYLAFTVISAELVYRYKRRLQTSYQKYVHHLLIKKN